MLKKDKPKANKAIHCLWLQAHDGLANEYWIQTLRNEDWAQHFKLVRLAVIKMKPTLGTSIPFPASLACQLEIKNWNYFCMLVDVCSNFRKKKTDPTHLSRILQLPQVDCGRTAAVCQRLSARHTHCSHHLGSHQWAAMLLTPPRSRKSFPFSGQKKCMSFLDVGCKTISQTKVPKNAKNMKLVKQQEATWSGERWQWAIVRAYTSTLHVRVWVLGKVLKEKVGWWMTTSHCLGFEFVFYSLAFYLTHRGNISFEIKKKLISCHGTKTMRSLKKHS